MSEGRANSAVSGPGWSRTSGAEGASPASSLSPSKRSQSCTAVSIGSESPASQSRVMTSKSISASEYPFTDMMAHPELVFDRLKDGRSQAKQLRGFYNDLAAIEQTYCKSILKLTNSTQFTANESMQMSLCGMLRFIEDSARSRLEWTNNLTTNMSSTLHQLSDDLKKERTQMSSAFADVKHNLEKHKSAAEKAHARYLASIHDVEREISRRQEALERGLCSNEKAMAKYRKKVDDAVHAFRLRKQAYRDAIDTHNTALSTFEKSARYILQNIEATDLARAQKMQTSLSGFQRSFSELLGSLESPIAVLKTAVDNITPRADLEQFVKMNRASNSSNDAVLACPLTFVDVDSDIVRREIQGPVAAVESVQVNEGPKMEIPEVPSSSWRTEPEPVPVPVSAEPVHTRETSRSLSQVMEALNVGAAASTVGDELLSSTMSSATSSTESSSVCPFVRTIYEYNEGGEECLSFGVGEFIFVLETISDDWARGRLNGREAMFPRMYTQGHEAARAVVIYEFEASNAEELSLAAGEQCWILDASDPHWFWAADQNGRQGNFPKSYCEP